MKMREVAVRGKKYKMLSGGEEVTALESIEDSVRVILPNDSITQVPKHALDLPVIDTRNYEKLK